MCKSRSPQCFILFVLYRPNFYESKSEFDNRNTGYSMTTGKKWTLKMSKEDETTPGPVYETQLLGSIQKKAQMTDELKNSSFGAFRDRQRQIPYKGFEKAYLGISSPGPTFYGNMEAAKVRAQLSVTKNSSKYSVPREARFFDVRKLDGPSPADYKNTNEVSSKVVLKRNGAYSMPKQERKIDFVKFSALHSSLVAKGYY